MTLRAAVIRERLRKLREVVRNLEGLRRVARDEFIADFHHHWLAERGLQLAADIVFDIGNHILVAGCNVSARDYADVIRRLGEQDVISSELRDRLEGLGGFRNILVHAYLDLDESRVFDHLATRLDDFVVFATEIESFLKRHPQ